MARATEKRREVLRALLIDVAERKMEANGIKGLTAREVAAEAGCAVGAIYNSFRDMDALAAAVNSRTAVRLEAAVADAFAGDQAASDPKRQLVLLGLTYLAFVTENNLLWSAIFELRSADEALSERQHAENARLMAHVVAPLHTLMPDSGDESRLLIARGLFSAVHGIVMLGQNGRFTAVSEDQIAAQITFIVERFCDGVTSTEHSAKD